ncbi:hypothetical protein BHE74_00040856 [Ensete ventricosum]|nr:hypothetical protein BHE74_00040856 [Ensete ventricosum]
MLASRAGGQFNDTSTTKFVDRRFTCSFLPKLGERRIRVFRPSKETQKHPFPLVEVVVPIGLVTCGLWVTESDLREHILSTNRTTYAKLVCDEVVEIRHYLHLRPHRLALHLHHPSSLRRLPFARSALTVHCERRPAAAAVDLHEHLGRLVAEELVADHEHEPLLPPQVVGAALGPGAELVVGLHPELGVRLPAPTRVLSRWADTRVT